MFRAVLATGVSFVLLAAPAWAGRSRWSIAYGPGPPPAPACQAEFLEPLTLYHIGHSLTDRMVDLLGDTVESWTGQPVAWAGKSIPGASLYWHWAVQPTEGRKGNIRTGDALEVLQSGVFDALVLTESTALDDFVGHPERSSEVHANLWVDEYLAATSQPDPKVFVYSTWYARNTEGPDTPETIATFLSETERLQELWEVIAQAIQDAHPALPVRIVPGGLVLKRLQEQVLDGTLILPGGLTFRETFFKRNRPGRGGGCDTRDWIHLSRAGIYTVALTHYAVIYGTCPIGLPSEIPYSGYFDGCVTAESVDVDPALAHHIQQVVWELVNEYEWAGMP